MRPTSHANAELKTRLAAFDEPRAGHVSAEREVEWLRALGETWRTADVLEAKADVIHAIYERIVVAGPEFIAAHLTPAAYAHGLALALREVVMAPTPVVSGWDQRASEGGTVEPEAQAMARPKADPSIVRPRCPEHPDTKVWLDGFERCRWSDAHRRPRYRCVTPEGTKGHAFSLPVAVRQPTERHPDSGVACPACEHVYGRHEGVGTGRDFVFGHAEIARLLLRVGEGMSLRAASRDLRQGVFRSGPEGHVSRQANLAVDYLDAFAPAIVAALHPTTWPRVLVIDARTLFTRGYRATRGRSSEGVPDEAWVGEQKAGTILVALDGTSRRPEPCLMRVAGAKDTGS
jgi:hypothetical protein